MGQEERIQNAYRGLGGKRTFYDGMITCSTLSGRAVCRLVWGMGRAETQDYLCVALSGIPEGFSGRLLEVPVGTGILTMPSIGKCRRRRSPAWITRRRCWSGQNSGARDLPMCAFSRGCWGAAFGDGSFDIVLSLNGFHAFPDKEAAWRRSFVYCGQAGSSAAASM